MVNQRSTFRDGFIFWVLMEHTTGEHFDESRVINTFLFINKDDLCALYWIYVNLEEFTHYLLKKKM